MLTYVYLGGHSRTKKRNHGYLLQFESPWLSAVLVGRVRSNLKKPTDICTRFTSAEFSRSLYEARVCLGNLQGSKRYKIELHGFHIFPGKGSKSA